MCDINDGDFPEVQYDPVKVKEYNDVRESIPDK